MKLMAVSKVFCYIRLASILGFPPVWAASVEVVGDKTSKNIDILMPGVQPKVPDTYFCSAMKVDSPFYIIGFQPKGKIGIAHHILLYGCAVPGSAEKVWKCGEMHDGQQLEQAPVCQSGERIMYSWALDAPEFHLPDGVGFRVGGDSSINWIVLEVHYNKIDSFLPPVNERDYSGIVLITTESRLLKSAGIYLLTTSGEIAPHSITYLETACSFNESIEMHPFAFRSHAHDHGKVISGYRVRNGEWTEIGRKSPQLPQMYYGVTQSGVTVKAGDFLAARCTFVNDDDVTVTTGSGAKDEMCNFYMMFYIDGERLPDENECATAGPPTWNWSLLRDLRSENAPLDASIVPGTTELLESTQEFTRDMNEGDGSRASG